MKGEPSDRDDDIRYEWMADSDLTRISEIDRSEHITRFYSMDGAKLQEETVDWPTPSWLEEGEGDFTIEHQIEFCLEHLEGGGVMLGAFPMIYW